MSNDKLLISAKKYKGDTTVVSARIPNDLLHVIDDVAEKTGRTRNEIIQKCLEFSIEKLEVQE